MKITYRCTNRDEIENGHVEGPPGREEVKRGQRIVITLAPFCPDRISSVGDLVLRFEGAPAQARDAAAAYRGAMVDKFAIVDDDSDMEPVADHLVQTSFETGLLDDHVAELLRRLA